MDGRHGWAGWWFGTIVFQERRGVGGGWEWWLGDGDGGWGCNRWGGNRWGCNGWGGNGCNGCNSMAIGLWRDGGGWGLCIDGCCVCCCCLVGCLLLTKRLKLWVLLYHATIRTLTHLAPPSLC